MNGPAVCDHPGPGSRRSCPDAPEAYEQISLMPRRSTGAIDEHVCKDGSISYRARVSAYGRREKVTLGSSLQGWNRVRAELELERIVGQIERGTWVPPRLEPRTDRVAGAMSKLGVDIDETLTVFARRWWESKRLRVGDSTVADYGWRLGYLERFFGRYRLSEITPRLVDRFRDELRDQAEAIREAAERGRPLLEPVTDRRGRTYQRRRRPLSNTSINAMLKLLGQIMQQAVDYELVDRNPVRVGERSARFLPRVRPAHTFLEIDEFHALLAAAGELDAEARADRQGLGRRAMLATLGLAGLRIGEMLELHFASVDLQRSRIKVHDAKTPAGVREVEMTLHLRDELVAYVMDRRGRGLPSAPADLFFGTASGGRRDPSRFRDRILARAVVRASENRAELGLPPLPNITPHSLRRTWATFAAMASRDPKWIASQIGHTDPALTFSVYQQVATRRFIDEAAVWSVMRFADEPDERTASRQLTRVEGASLRLNVPTDRVLEERLNVAHPEPGG